MKFSLDSTKEAPETFLSGRKQTKSAYPVVYFDSTFVNSGTTNKHFGVIIGSKLIYGHYLQYVFSKLNKKIGLLRKREPTLPK